MMDYKQEPGSAVSVASSTGTLCAPSLPMSGKRLHIQSNGIRLIWPPLPMSQKEVPIYSEDGALVYVAAKDQAWTCRWVLSSPKQGPLVSIECLPGGRPWLRRLDSGTGHAVPSIGLRAKWTSRAVTFAPSEGARTLEWKYVKMRMANSERLATLRLEQTEEREGLLHTQPVAHLVRGAPSCHAAGQGGELILESEGATGEVDEALVVASCLVMLRRERDRRRFVQAMVLGAAVS
ncbi:uncharacterized protein LDX57_012075 [Aspergillus melleus]|uniref:uncharacterized protein n=1 Tax=Aspergillus melleus TaxID=138277 RepID=UPI001E8D8A39|nr:uncharacterized protein LDX57_012075 [Aspergillus melleus]KAH8434428.1 hypothetical protein LDX57_012075 [Aspergillus melleus]